MRSLNQTPGNDNAIIWLVKITDGTNTYKLATSDITLSGNAWDGQVLASDSDRFSLNEIGKRINISDGGTIGEPAATTFSIARFTSNALTNTFFNEYYPATSGKLLVGQNVEIGICWNTATTEAEITWLFTYKIEDYGYNMSVINITCTEVNEFEDILIPYYKIQKETDDDISYFINAPEGNYGRCLPIVYGDFSIYRDAHSLFKPIMFPVICVDQLQLIYIAGSHKFAIDNMSSGGSSILYQYLSGMKTYMKMTCANGSSTNNYESIYATIFDTVNSTDNIVYGRIDIQPQLPATYNDITDIKNALDDSTSTECEVTAANPGDVRLSAKLDATADPIGQLSRNANSVFLSVTLSAVGASSDFTLFYYNTEYNVGTGAASTGQVYLAAIVGTYIYDFSNDFSAREDSGKPWTLEELTSYEYYALVEDGNSITIQNMWLTIDNIIVARTASARIRGEGARYYGDRYGMGGRGRRR